MDSIPARMKRNGTDPAYKDRIAYHVKNGMEWIGHSFEDYYQETLQVACSLIALGVQPNGKMCILAFNRPEWIIADVACMMVGAIPAGIYQTCSPEEVQYIIHHSESSVIIVENEEQWKKVQAQREKLPKLKHIILMRGSQIDDDMTLSWEDFLQRGRDIDPQQVFSRINAIEPAQPATFIYTSGTTGPPKAVMLSHENLTFTADRAIQLIEPTADDCTLSYLPLSHIAEQIFSIHAPISIGFQIYFAESIDKLPDNLKEVQPTIFFGVPRIWEKFYAGIQQKLQGAPFYRKWLANWAIGVGQKVSAKKNQGQEPTGLLKLQYKLASSSLYPKIKQAIGLSRSKVCISGAAPISKEILSFMSGLDVIIHEVYGQSEDSGPTSFNRPGATKFGTVGPAFIDVEIKIAEDNEILVRGKNVFLGYYKDEEATNATLKDGWLYSGDLGSVDDDGFLTITGRKKEIIITAGGKNITPKNIEAALKDLPLISQAVVVGDARKFISALLTLDVEAASEFATKHGLATTDLHKNQTLITAIQEGVNQVNSKLARVENVRKFRILPRDLTIADAELTPTLKVKRRIVYQNWAEVIESIYAD